MDVRLVQVGFLFNKFHRVVRDAATLEKKNVTLKLEGTEAEIDRNVLQVISDSLIHLIRNAVGHGIESPEERKLAGKPKEGSIWLNARNENDAVIIDIRDDGKGLNHEKIKSKAVQQGLITQEDADKLSVDDINLLIFEPGFSTVDQVTAISGRGVGMDVVKQTLDSIGGTIEVHSESGKGTLISLSLPSSMAVKSCLLFELASEVYALPLSYTESVISLYKSDIHKIGGGLVATHLNKNIAIVFLKDLFDQASAGKNKENVLQRSYDTIHDEEKLEIVVVSFNNRSAGFVVDKLLQQKEIVEKPLMKPVDKVKYISGVTILGSGNVCLVLNVASLLQYLFSGNAHANSKLSKNIILN
jgi:two-component system chemotaxis sensor kinase CheA